jgi:epoxyqueuosine reductase
MYTNTAIKSLCIVATPSPRNIIKFEYEDSYINVEVPPIYVDRKEVLNNIKSITSHLFSKFGYKTFPVILPKKSLSVHSGLAKYGKNNLVYVEGMGSYHRLTAFASDIPCDIGEWYELSHLETCHSCGACEKSCPTKAINNKDFVIDADKCIAFYNEQSEPFPDWINPSWHNSLIGCLICQNVCPYNRAYKQYKKVIAAFTKRETILITNQIPFCQLSEDLQKKLRSLSLDIYYDKISRNLEMLYKKR